MSPPIFVAATDSNGKRIWLLNPECRVDDIRIRFGDRSPVVIVPAMPGKTARMHMSVVEHFLDSMQVSWATAPEEKPQIVVLAEEDTGSVVVWPFKLTGPLPHDVVRLCVYDEICTVPTGTSFILYGGM